MRRIKETPGSETEDSGRSFQDKQYCHAINNTMSNTQVAQEWASQKKSSGRGSNFFFEDGVIYSYGPHFPIARIVPGPSGAVVLFTTKSYSPSTARHILCASTASHHMETFYVDDVMSEHPEASPNLENLNLNPKPY